MTDDPIATRNGRTEGGVAYLGRDLEAMAFAENYHRWILDVFAPYLGNRVIEVGAGRGSFSELLLERPLALLALVEPSQDMYQLLAERVHAPNGPRIATHNATFGEVAEQMRVSFAPDSVVYVNVLEHIEDDRAELETVYRTLVLGGRVFIFVPAFSWLYGAFDEQVGHHRRYTRRDLEHNCERAGFQVLMSRYFDFPGILPWWIKYRLLQSTALQPGTVRAYDRYVVPVARAFEARVRPPLGKNVLLIAEKS